MGHGHHQQGGDPHDIGRSSNCVDHMVPKMAATVRSTARLCPGDLTICVQGAELSHFGVRQERLLTT